MNLKRILPADIEKRGFEIIIEEPDNRILNPENEAVIERVIHTTADFDYANNLTSSPHTVTKGLEALRLGTPIITDTDMDKAGINGTALHRTGSEVYCFMADEDVAKAAREAGTTGATANMDKAVALSPQGKDYVFAIGNVPTALIRIKGLVDQEEPHPKLIITVPVGFVNMVQARELTLDLDTPYIIARRRRDDSNVAAVICNVLLYQLCIQEKGENGI